MPSTTVKEAPIGDDQDVLQAVILADSFNSRLKPLTLNRPRCLLPICNAPLLDWTFESLAMAGIQEVFVICRSHAELVKAAIRESQWSKPTSGMKIVPIVTAKETFSPGDAMRDVYTHGIITTDFVLVAGDLISNLHIDEVIRAHKLRRKTNKDAIVTMVVKESGARHRTRSRGDSSVFVVDAETSECLHYEPVLGYPPTKYVHIPREILTKHPEVEVRNDLVDCFIDVCSVEVPSLFQDNFDYQDLRRDFLHGVLTSDLLMKNIYCHVIKEGYAARVTDTRSYDAVSKDILTRWTFPFVPDDNYPGGPPYEHLRGNRYIAKDNSVILSRTCKIGTNTLIGPSTQVCDNAQVTSSVIGQRCTIGAGSVVRDSYVFDDTVIEPHCVIERSIVGGGVCLKEGSAVRKGCVIGDQVVLGPEARLGPFERVSKRREKLDVEHEDEDVDSELEEAEARKSFLPGFRVDSLIETNARNVDATSTSRGMTLGSDSNALVWPRGPSEEDEDPESVENFKNRRLMRIGDDASDLELSDSGSISSSGDEDSDTSDEEASDEGADHSSARFSASSSIPVPGASAAAESEFRKEVELSLQRAFAEGHSVDNAAVELKTLRMASNVPLGRVREAVVAAIVDQIEIVEGGFAAQRQEIARVIGRWGALINKIGGVDAVETIFVLQHHCSSSERLALFGQILAALYQADIVEENHIRDWHNKPKSMGLGLKDSVRAENMKSCWAVGERMIQQFDEQDSESE